MQVDITANLRRVILGETYKPGARLPTVRDLTALVEQGFITTAGRHGTHVVEPLPHRCCCGLVMAGVSNPNGRYAYRRTPAISVEHLKAGG